MTEEQYPGSDRTVGTTDGPERAFQGKEKREPRIWKCRDCRTDVEVGAFTIEVALECNRLCHVMGLDPLYTTELVRCVDCTLEYKQLIAERCIRAYELLKQLRFAVAQRSAEGWMRHAPDWFKEEYRPDIAKELNRMGRLSTREPQQMVIR